MQEWKKDSNRVRELDTSSEHLIKEPLITNLNYSCYMEEKDWHRGHFIFLHCRWHEMLRRFNDYTSNFKEFAVQLPFLSHAGKPKYRTVVNVRRSH